MYKTYKWQLGGLVLALIVFCIQLLLPEAIFDRYYYKGLYQGWRSLWDASVGLSPIPLLYLLLTGLMVYMLAQRVGRKVHLFRDLLRRRSAPDALDSNSALAV